LGRSRLTDLLAALPSGPAGAPPMMPALCVAALTVGKKGSPLTPQDWLARLLARPLADPLDWESYSLTIVDPTWKAVWAVIESHQAYDDGLELALRLLQATRQHHDKLEPRAYASARIRLYRNVLVMLEKAARWEAYLRAWDAILAQTDDLCVSVTGEAAAENKALAALIRRPDGGFGVEPHRYGVPWPSRVEVHFLHTQLSRRALVARRLASDLRGTPAPSPAGALSTDAVLQRLIEAGGRGHTTPPVVPGFGARADGGSWEG